MLIGFLELTETRTTDTGSEEDLDHWYCGDCHPEGDKALCATNLAEWSDVSDDEDWEPDCIVCLNMTRCPECGDVF